MPKLDNEPCGVEVPILFHPRLADAVAGTGVAPREFSVWLTRTALRDRRKADWRDIGAMALAGELWAKGYIR